MTKTARKKAPRKVMEADPKPLTIVGTRQWRQTVPPWLQQPLAEALTLMEENKIGEAMMKFADCCFAVATEDPEDWKRQIKPILYFGGQIAAQAYFSLRGAGHEAPAEMLNEWRRTAQMLIEGAYETAPEDAVACHNVGRFLQDIGQDKESIKYYREALNLSRGTQVESWGNLGTALYQLGRVKDAEHCWDECIKLPSDLPSGRMAQAYIWLRRGDYERGWAAFNDRWKDLVFLRGYGRDKELGGVHWFGEKLNPKKHTLLVHGEQGLGDHVQFARYVRVLKDQGYPIIGLETRGILKRWMEASFPDIPIYERDAGNLPTFTHHCSSMDLPAILGTLVETIPGPVVPTIAGVSFAGGSFRVGIAWEGAKGNPADSLRSIPTEQLQHLADIPGVTWVSLQFGKDAGIHGRAWLGKDFIDTTKDCVDVLDGAQLMKTCDLVVCVDTLTAHLAGTLGIPTWVLHRYCSEWRWSVDRGPISRWYPSIRNMKLGAPNDWESLLRHVRYALEEMVANR